MAPSAEKIQILLRAALVANAFLEENLEKTLARAVHTMRRAHDLVVLLALPVALFPHPVFIAQLAQAVGEGLAPPGQIC
jgi:hypothetical protein